MAEDKTPNSGGVSGQPSGQDSPSYLGQLDGYILIKQLGSGGMGNVYLGQSKNNPEMLRAIKIIKPDTDSDLEQLVDRWQVECRVSERLRALKHQHIVQVYDGKAIDVLDEFHRPVDSVFYLAMEYVEGETLGSLMKGTSLTIAEGLKVGVDISSALEAAHDIGVMHRDVKPNNIIVGYRAEGQPHAYLLDFGISKLLHQGGGITRRHGEIAVGTLNYMPPEELLKIIGRDVPETNEKGDVWCFGKVLYEMFARVVNPYTDPTESSHNVGPQKAALRALGWSPKEIPDLSKDLNALIRNMTVWKPELRPDMRQVRYALGQELHMCDAGAGTQPIVLGPQQVRLEKLIKDIRSEHMTGDEFAMAQGLFIVVPADAYFQVTHPNAVIDSGYARKQTYFKIFAPPSKQEWIFGRGESTDCRYADPAMSKTHFKIARSPIQVEDDEEARYTVSDLNSSNGTRLNGVRIDARKPEFLNSGDKIGAGNLSLTFALPRILRAQIYRGDTMQFRTLRKDDKTPQQRRLDSNQQGA